MKFGNRVLRAAALALAGLLTVNLVVAKAPKSGEDSILLIVMDPLARELACACVKGYGQRDYRKLAAHLDSALKERVKVEFSDDLADSMASVSPVREVIVIGDRSLVAHGAKKGGLNCHAICELTDLDGNTTMSSSFIVRADDSAKELKEVSNRKIFVGLAEGDEKYTASLAALRDAGVVSSKKEKHQSYSDAALDLLDSDLSPLPVAVIPTYALRMLEGCGSVKPGNLRVIGKTQPVPFITVFVSDKMPAEKRENISKALLSIKEDEKLLNALESKDGFRAVKEGANDSSWQTPRGADSKRRVEVSEPSWPDWRGPHRDGHVPRLPTRLPSAVKVVWKKGAVAGGLAGLSVSGGRVISAERDFADENDVYRCLNADSGELIWRQQFLARGKSLDYGQSPRATPVIHDGRVYLLGAFGDLRCVNFADGKLIWERHLPSEFHAELPTWGMCSTPLIVDDLLIVNPGSTNASLAALDCGSGVSRWTTSGWPAAYSAFVCANLGTRRQIVGYDQRSLGGWDVQSGRRLWELAPPGGRDFNVPTPIAFDGSVVVATENNGTRVYRFDQFGQIDCKPAASFADLAPETISPVSIQDRLFGVANHRLYCLDLRQGLRPVWSHESEALGDHASLIADDARLLVITLSGELILLDARADTYAVLSRMRLFEDDVELYSHPALVGTRLYARGGSSIVCVDLGLD